MIYEIPRGVIVLEGPDACGKTTLARTILERHGGRYIHLRESKRPVHYLWAALRRAARYAQDQLVVIDRHWLSEQIYAHVYRGGVVDDHASRIALGYLRAMKAVQVFCLPSVASCAERHARMHKTQRELYKPDDRIRLVSKLYWQALRGHSNANEVPCGSPQSFLGQTIRRGGIASICQGQTLLYDIDTDGEFVVDVAATIVEKAMLPRCHMPRII